MIAKYKMIPNSLVIKNLLLRIKNNDEEAFYDLYLMLKPQVYGYSFSILKNREDALDNVQDVFINIYKYISYYNSNDKPLSWILKITKNLAITKLRKRKITYDIDNEIISTDDKKENKVFLRHLMKNLSEEERNVIILHNLWGFKFNEIAKILDSNLSTILSKYHRSIKKMRKWGETK